MFCYQWLTLKNEQMTLSRTLRTMYDQRLTVLFGNQVCLSSIWKAYIHQPLNLQCTGHGSIASLLLLQPTLFCYSNLCFTLNKMDNFFKYLVLTKKSKQFWASLLTSLFWFSKAFHIDWRNWKLNWRKKHKFKRKQAPLKKKTTTPPQSEPAVEFYLFIFFTCLFNLPLLLFNLPLLPFWQSPTNHA